MNAFLKYRLPGDKTINTCSFTGIANGCLIFDKVSIVPWLGTDLSNNTIMPVPDESTSESYYLDTISKLIAQLRKRGGKTVICRQIAGRFNDFSLEQISQMYFEKFPDMFCFLFYHETTGYWLGASPELLFEIDADGHAKTRALAGTRNRSNCRQWSAKNMAEHEIVVDDIVQRIYSVSPSAKIKKMDRYDFRYGAIDHLCTPIEMYNIIKDDDTIDKFISAIHPTAAVGGYPREEALEDIADLEQTPRCCYGGYVSVCEEEKRIVYVILRCVHFNEKQWAVYTGSGITAESLPEDEWKETADKAAPLVDLLRKF